jgi:hypothetical protein
LLSRLNTFLTVSTGLFTLRRRWRLGLRNGYVIPLRSIPTPPVRHILPALAFAAQSPYSGLQNAVNSQNVMRNTGLNLLGNKNIIKKGLDKILSMFNNC